MRTATVRELRNEIADIIGSSETVMVTRHGKLAGFFLPWKDERDLPLELKREVIYGLRKELDNAFSKVKINEKEMISEFESWRDDRGRRRR